MIALAVDIWTALVIALDFAVGLFAFLPNPVEIVTWGWSHGIAALVAAAAYGAGAFWVCHVRGA